MGQFTNGVVIGLGLALLFAPKKGEEVRSILVERFQTMNGNSPENEELKQQVQKMSGRVQEAQQLANRAAEIGGSVQSDLNTVAGVTGADILPPTTPPHTLSSTRPNPTRKP